MRNVNDANFLSRNKIDLENTQKLFQEKKLNQTSFCVMPFSNIILEPDGNIGVCRHKGCYFTFGNIREKSLEEIWESPEIQNWRKEHLSDNPVICKTELEDRRCNLCPELNKLLPFAEITNVVNPKILRLTANLNGQCNLKCQMCAVWKEPNGFYSEENFWIPARKKLFKEIKEIDFLSGEPFIQNDTYKFIDELSIINPECQWSFTTNLHWNLTPKIKTDLDKIKIKYILISIDSLIPDTYHQIRHPGKLDFVLKNLDNLLVYQNDRIEKNLGDLSLRINFLIQKENWREIKPATNFCLEKNITPFISFLYGPKGYSLLDFDYEQRIDVLDFYFETLSKDELLFSQRVIKPLIKSLNKIDYIHYLQTLQALTRK